MLWLFTSYIMGENFVINGEDANHISHSLRMKAGEQLMLCTDDGMEHLCEIKEITSDSVRVEVLSSKPCENEPSVKVTLYQALTKSDKMDTIIQKAIELGVYKIVPVISARCISRPDEKSMAKKLERWNKIAKQAAMQSRRGIIPKVENLIEFTECAEKCQEYDAAIVYYELGGESTSGIVQKEKTKNIAVFIGSEGGFEQSEVDLIIKSGGKAGTLGKRILRTETAPLAALSVIMYITGNME